MHPARRRCSAVKSSRYSPSSRPAARAPHPSRCDGRLPPRAARRSKRLSGFGANPSPAPNRWRRSTLDDRIGFEDPCRTSEPGRRGLIGGRSSQELAYPATTYGAAFSLTSRALEKELAELAAVSIPAPAWRTGPDGGATGMPCRPTTRKPNSYRSSSTQGRESFISRCSLFATHEQRGRVRHRNSRVLLKAEISHVGLPTAMYRPGTRRRLELALWTGLDPGRATQQNGCTPSVTQGGRRVVAGGRPQRRPTTYTMLGRQDVLAMTRFFLDGMIYNLLGNEPGICARVEALVDAAKIEIVASPVLVPSCGAVLSAVSRLGSGSSWSRRALR